MHNSGKINAYRLLSMVSACSLCSINVHYHDDDDHHHYYHCYDNIKFLKMFPFMALENRKRKNSIINQRQQSNDRRKLESVCLLYNVKCLCLSTISEGHRAQRLNIVYLCICQGTRSQGPNIEQLSTKFFGCWVEVEGQVSRLKVAPQVTCRKEIKSNDYWQRSHWIEDVKVIVELGESAFDVFLETDAGKQ